MIEAGFRFRSAESESTADRHDIVLSRLRPIAWLWNDSPRELVLCSGGESAACDLTPCLREGITGAISYSARYPGRMSDRAMFDDVLTLHVDPNIVDYLPLATEVFEQIAAAFSAYRAAIIHDLELELDDFDSICELAQSSGRDINGRDTVYRIHPVNYFDDELCQRSFGMRSNEVADRLSGVVDFAVARDTGVLVVATTKILERDALNALNDSIADRLIQN